MKTTASAFLLSALLSLPAWSQLGTGKRVDPDESLPDVVSELETAWNKHDGKAMAAVWHENGDYISADGRRANGREEIGKFFAEEQAGLMKDTTVAIKVLTWQALVRGIIFADAEAVVTGLKDAAGKPRPPMKYHIALTAMAKQGQLWLVNVRPYVLPTAPLLKPKAP